MYIAQFCRINLKISLQSIWQPVEVSPEDRRKSLALLQACEEGRHDNVSTHTSAVIAVFDCCNDSRVYCLVVSPKRLVLVGCIRITFCLSWTGCAIAAGARDNRSSPGRRQLSRTGSEPTWRNRDSFGSLLLTAALHSRVQRCFRGKLSPGFAVCLVVEFCCFAIVLIPRKPLRVCWHL